MCPTAGCSCPTARTTSHWQTRPPGRRCQCLPLTPPTRPTSPSTRWTMTSRSTSISIMVAGALQLAQGHSALPSFGWTHSEKSSLPIWWLSPNNSYSNWQNRIKAPDMISSFFYFILAFQFLRSLVFAKSWEYFLLLRHNHGIWNSGFSLWANTALAIQYIMNRGQKMRSPTKQNLFLIEFSHQFPSPSHQLLLTGKRQAININLVSSPAQFVGTDDAILRSKNTI